MCVPQQKGHLRVGSNGKAEDGHYAVHRFILPFAGSAPCGYGTGRVAPQRVRDRVHAHECPRGAQKWQLEERPFTSD